MPIRTTTQTAHLNDLPISGLIFNSTDHPDCPSIFHDPTAAEINSQRCKTITCGSAQLDRTRRNGRQPIDVTTSARISPTSSASTFVRLLRMLGFGERETIARRNEEIPRVAPNLGFFLFVRCGLVKWHKQNDPTSILIYMPSHWAKTADPTQQFASAVFPASAANTNNTLSDLSPKSMFHR